MELSDYRFNDEDWLDCSLACLRACVLACLLDNANFL